MAHRWDPDRYLTYADERGRPFVELIARIRAEPRTVVDLGCGPGNLTALLAERWPQAQVRGLDSSPEMIASARRDVPAIDFEVADLRAWLARGEHADVIVSNATLQWLPDHLELLPALSAAAEWLAFQVPGNFGEQSHVIVSELAAEPAYAEHTRDAAVPSSREPVEYLEALTDLGWEVDAWETTYLHVLEGDEDAVFTWVSGTGAQPTLQALPGGLRADFEAELKRRLREAYPSRDGRVVLPFRRIFVVTQGRALR